MRKHNQSRTSRTITQPETMLSFKNKPKTVENKPTPSAKPSLDMPKITKTKIKKEKTIKSAAIVVESPKKKSKTAPKRATPTKAKAVAKPAAKIKSDASAARKKALIVSKALAEVAKAFNDLAEAL